MSTIKKKRKILIVAESNNIVVKSVSHWLVERHFEIVRLNSETDEFSIVNMNIDQTSFTFKIIELPTSFP